MKEKEPTYDEIFKKKTDDAFASNAQGVEVWARLLATGIFPTFLTWIDDELAKKEYDGKYTNIATALAMAVGILYVNLLAEVQSGKEPEIIRFWIRQITETLVTAAKDKRRMEVLDAKAMREVLSKMLNGEG